MPVSPPCSLYIPFSGCVSRAQCVLRSEITVQELLLAICSEQLIPVSFSPWCLVGFLDLREQRVLLAVGTCRARPLHTIPVLCHTQTCQQGRSGQASEAPLVSSQSSSVTEVQHCVSINIQLLVLHHGSMPRQNVLWSCQFWDWLWHSYKSLCIEARTYNKARS